MRLISTLLFALIFFSGESLALTIVIDPASPVRVLHRSTDTNGNVTVLVAKGARVTINDANPPATAVVVTTDGSGKVSVSHRLNDGSDAIVQVDKSATVTVGAVQPAPAPSADADFAARRSGPGVIRWFGFDDPTQVKGPMTPNGYTAWAIEAGNSTTPTFDASVKSSGASSLRMDIPSLSSGNAAGDFRANFSDDLSVQFGENSEFFIQWRQRFNQAFIDTYFTVTYSDGSVHPQEGIKQFIVTAADQPKQGGGFGSCEAIGVVMATYYQRRMPQLYDSCVGSASHGPYSGMSELIQNTPVYDGKIQNGPTLNCTYQGQYYVTPKTALPPGCWGWVANEWMTFEMRVKTGARNATTNEFDNSEVQLWGARDGGDPVLIVDWHPGIKGYFPLTANDKNFTPARQENFGKVYLIPYMTAKDKTQVHPLCQTWYDELIVSRQSIPFPGSKILTVPRVN